MIFKAVGDGRPYPDHGVVDAGLHRAVRAAPHQRPVLHARVLVLEG